MTTERDTESRGTFPTWEARLAFERQMGRMEAEREAAKVVALIVEAAGGSVFVPDGLAVGPDLLVSDEPMANGRRYFTRTVR